MEQTSTPPLMPQEPSSKKPGTPWGLFIGLILILVVIVAGAYYAFNQRIAPQLHPQTQTN